MAFATFSKNASSGLSQASLHVFRLIRFVCLSTAMSSCFQLVLPICLSSLSCTCPCEKHNGFLCSLQSWYAGLSSLSNDILHGGEPPCQLPLTVLALCAPHNPDSTADHLRLPCNAQPQAKPDSGHRICSMLCFICGITFFMSPEIFLVDMFLFLS